MLTAQFTKKTFDFDKWFPDTTVEHNIGSKYLVLTDYETSIEIDTEYPTATGTCWKADMDLPVHQMERLFEKVEDFIKNDPNNR